jgi:hypothetical protein
MEKVHIFSTRFECSLASFALVSSVFLHLSRPFRVYFQEDPAVNAAAAFLLGVLNNSNSNNNTTTNGTDFLVDEIYTRNECKFGQSGSPPDSPKLQHQSYYNSENSNFFGASTANATSSNFSGSFPGGNLRSYWTWALLWKLTVVLNIGDDIEFLNIGLLRYGNLQSYWT